MAISLRQFQQLIAIAELGSFRRAAEKLFIAQPALSISIQKMEQEVGTPLLERGTKGVELTPAGQAMLQDARTTLFYADQACRAAQLVAQGESGCLRLGFVGSATYHLLPTSLNTFRARYPNVKLALHEDSTIGLLNLVRTHELDAAVVRGPITEDPTLESWTLQHDDLVLAVPAGHHLAKHKQVQLSACSQDGFLLYASTVAPGLHSVALGLCQAAGFTPCINQEAIQVQTMVSLVASGTGIALVPGVTREYANNHVRYIELADAGAHRCISLLLVAKRSCVSPILKKLREIMSPPENRFKNPEAETALCMS